MGSCRMAKSCNICVSSSWLSSGACKVQYDAIAQTEQHFNYLQWAFRGPSCMGGADRLGAPRFE